MLADPAILSDAADAAAAQWSSVSAGPWLADTLKTLRAPDGAGIDPGEALRGALRPYQKAGVHWLHLLSGLGLGACLADDMGLGKTIQVLALLLVHKFVCRGTVEERIDAMIESKQGLSDALLTGGSEIGLTEMSDEALLRLVALDLTAAMTE
jgi:SNF2 family DNA or RNA helicase